jgi:kynureninase
MRFGLAPAYLRFTDVWDAVAALRGVLELREWDRPQHRLRAKVT